MKPKHDVGRFRALAARLEEAAASAGVSVTREEIPYGAKLTLSAGHARGVIALYTTGKIVPNPGALAHFGDLVAAMGGTVRAPAAGTREAVPAAPARARPPARPRAAATEAEAAPARD